MDKYNPEFDLTKYDKSRQQKDLSIEQQNAIDLLITGKSDGETAKLVGVARQTVWNWRNNDTLFYTELNKRRQDLWSANLERISSLAIDALDVVAEDLQQTDDFKARLNRGLFRPTLYRFLQTRHVSLGHHRRGNRQGNRSQPFTA